ncbi:hypothetical protein F2P81_014529 [Scophthalmus maximus]|uniref:Proline-rich protein 15-like protein A n=1 Tax=Scophthalmus maximus TaxID=52904 RepID=A0A6A4SI94_SCOMX|nr:hypothetical protein F2P81_014529 [Scophthalmus maximus]
MKDAAKERNGQKGKSEGGMSREGKDMKREKKEPCPSHHSSIMSDSSSSWWKLTFLRRHKSQPEVLYEIPAEFIPNASTGQEGSGAATEAAAHAEVNTHDSQLDTRLEKIMDKSTASKGRHVKVSHSGRFKEKKKMRVTLGESPEMFAGSDPENQRARK